MRRFGIEVEYGFAPGVSDGERAVQFLRDAGLCQEYGMHGYMGHSDSGWIVKNDGSLHGRGAEMVSPPLDFDDPEQRGQVDRAIKALLDSGARTLAEAGIHIHVDCSDLDAKQVAAVARCFTKFEDLIYRIASSGWQSMRPGSGNYCPPMTDEQISKMARVRDEHSLAAAYFGNSSMGVTAGASHGHSARYCGINIHSWFYRKTIEFRVFNSSMNSERIQAYIALCIALVEDARRGKVRSTNKAYRLGGMKEGITKPNAAYHRLQQVVRYDAGMSLEDMKRLNKVWKDSVPQAKFARRSY